MNWLILILFGVVLAIWFLSLSSADGYSSTDSELNLTGRFALTPMTGDQAGKGFLGKNLTLEPDPTPRWSVQNKMLYYHLPADQTGSKDQTFLLIYGTWKGLRLTPTPFQPTAPNHAYPIMIESTANNAIAIKVQILGNFFTSYDQGYLAMNSKGRLDYKPFPYKWMTVHS